MENNYLEEARSYSKAARKSVKVLKKAGWEFHRGGNGDHEMWKHPLHGTAALDTQSKDDNQHRAVARQIQQKAKEYKSKNS